MKNVIKSAALICEKFNLGRSIHCNATSFDGVFSRSAPQTCLHNIDPGRRWCTEIYFMSTTGFYCTNSQTSVMFSMIMTKIRKKTGCCYISIRMCTIILSLTALNNRSERTFLFQDIKRKKWRTTLASLTASVPTFDSGSEITFFLIIFFFCQILCFQLRIEIKELLHHEEQCGQIAIFISFSNCRFIDIVP